VTGRTAAYTRKHKAPPRSGFEQSTSRLRIVSPTETRIALARIGAPGDRPLRWRSGLTARLEGRQSGGRPPEPLAHPTGRSLPLRKGSRGSDSFGDTGIVTVGAGPLAAGLPLRPLPSFPESTAADGRSGLLEFIVRSIRRRFNVCDGRGHACTRRSWRLLLRRSTLRLFARRASYAGGSSQRAIRGGSSSG